MKTGIYVPIPHVTAHSARLGEVDAAGRRGLDPGTVDPGYRLALDSVTEAESLGFDIALFAERHLGTDLESWVLAAAVASHTHRITIMPAMNPDFWHPNIAAKMAATLDRVAPGRSAINFVTGWNTAENTFFSTVRPTGEEEKYSRAERYIETMRATWAADADLAAHLEEGEEFTAAPMPLVPAGGPPPFHTVSRSPRGLEMVARCADHWFVDYGTDPERPFAEVLETARVSVERMRERAARYNRTVGFGLSAFVVPAETERAGWDEVARLRAEATARSPELVIPKLGAVGAQLVGPAELIGERVAAYAEIGVDLVLCKYVPEPDALPRLASVLARDPAVARR
ncbi:FMNH2-dependent alkanesulfonate monooxygenase [Pseudonocardia halophobica]|uniref:Methanesulfonate monooxygenase n=1 Tax=Pseudonocardia halophobica TaxID=29401 RepID=A0A9W6L6B8_9PSEU|nr:LLM class flavin-dependent oxidoreductase [Pseudonocardia halophobica]GLL14461.1 methanesulfonate monooxygenase [Pseudonocardia halophobica]